jgi:hypothetical protein
MTTMNDAMMATMTTKDAILSYRTIPPPAVAAMTKTRCPLSKDTVERWEVVMHSFQIALMVGGLGHGEACPAGDDADNFLV